MSQTVLTIIGGIGVIALLIAAALWFWASALQVPDNIDTFISVLQKIGRINAWAAAMSGVAALCAFITWVASLLG